MNHTARSIEAYLSSVASPAVAPAGGSTVAIVGAAGASLCEMARIHAANPAPVALEPLSLSPAPTAADSDVVSLREALRSRRRRLLDLAETDAVVAEETFGPEMAPTALDGQMQRALEVPVAIARALVDVTILGTAVLRVTEGPVAVDGRMGGLLAHGAYQATQVTIDANVAAMSETAVPAGLVEHVQEIETRAAAAIEQLRVSA